MSEPFDPRYFRRQDETPDDLFYIEPRFTVHIDDDAIAAATEIYREVLPEGGAILDLMSSWRSHLPPDVTYSRLAGLGMNAEEMAGNPRLTDHVVHNLNINPILPFADDEFDGCCCTVSVQYLTKPVEVFREVNRVLRPGAPFVLTFSNRCFPTKAVAVWRSTADREHANIIASYFHAAGNWGEVYAQDRSPRRTHYTDPLFGVWSWKRGGEQR